MTPVLIVGWLAAFVGTVLGVPQLVRLVRTRNIEGLSLPAWQAILALNVGWTAHGLILGQVNMVVPNVLGLASTLPILVLMSRALRRNLALVMLPGVLGGLAMIAADLTLGTAVYGMVALVPALFANAGQSIELVRSHRVVGVSPLFLATGALNQVLWLAWGLLVVDMGTIITATVTLVHTLFNFVWWALRSLGMRAFFVVAPAPDPVPAMVHEPENAETGF